LILEKQKAFRARFLILIYILVDSTIKSLIAKLSESLILGFHLLFLFNCLWIAQGNLKLKFSTPPAFPHAGMFCWAEKSVPQENTVELILPLHTTTFLSPPCHFPLLPPCAFPQACGVLGRKIFSSGVVIFFHPYRERSKFRRLFFIHRAEDVTLVNKSNSLLPTTGRTDPCIYLWRTVSCFVTSSEFSFPALVLNQSLCFPLTKAREKLGHGAAQVQGSIQGELALGASSVRLSHGPEDWTSLQNASALT